MYEASFESLTKFQCPDWFRDVKFYVMKSKGRKSTVITSLDGTEQVSAVRLPGCGAVGFHQYPGALVVELPETLPTEYAAVLELSFQ